MLPMGSSRAFSLVGDGVGLERQESRCECTGMSIPLSDSR